MSFLRIIYIFHFFKVLKADHENKYHPTSSPLVFRKLGFVFVDNFGSVDLNLS